MLKSHLSDYYNASRQERKKVPGDRIEADQYISTSSGTNLCKETVIAQNQAVEHPENF